MSEAILLNQYSQNNGGGGNPWDIPPFNWYGKGVIETKTLDTAGLNNSNPTGTETLQSIVNVSGKGVLYFTTFSFSDAGAFLLKISLDNEPFLFTGYYMPSYGGLGGFYQGYTSMLNTATSGNNSGHSISNLFLNQANLKNGLNLPLKQYKLASDYNTSAYSTMFPVPFNENLKIEFNVSNTAFKISYMYDLFDE